MQQQDANKFDPGPSGTAIAGLIIALAALAVALYGVLQPQQMPVKATEQMVERAVQAELAPYKPTLTASMETEARLAARDEVNKMLLLPAPGCDPWTAKRSNAFQLFERIPARSPVK